MLNSILKNKSSNLTNYLNCIKRNLATSKFNENLKLSYYSREAATPLSLETIGQRLDRAAEEYENHEAHIFLETGHRLTFKDLKHKAEDLASGLVSIGIKKGDRVGLWAPNCYEWVLTQFATALIGVIQVNINPAYKASELEFAAKKVGCSGIIMSETFKTQNYLEILSKVCPELESSKAGGLNSKKLPLLKNIIVIGNKKFNGCYSFNDILAGAGSEHKKKMLDIKADTDASDPINIQYTSGTTGFPKGVTLSHHMIINNAMQKNAAINQTSKDRICLPLPLYHCFGMVLGSLATICNGMAAVYPSSSFHPEACLKAIDKEKCTSFYGTPTMFIDVINHPNFSKYNVSSLEKGIMGGSTCPVELMRDCAKLLNINQMIAGYGMTECSPLVVVNSNTDTFENRTQTIGKGLEHLEIKIADSQGKTVPIDAPGELLVRGYNTMLGYWNDEEKTKEAFTLDRFYKSGDLVKMDSKGYVRFIGRLKDMIIRGGENIYPREIEEFIHKHPKVSDVYVVGVPDKRLGEELCACIKLKDNVKASVEEIKEFCKNDMAVFKIPKYIEFVNEFPMTVTGKIQKNILKEIMAKKLFLK